MAEVMVEVSNDGQYVSSIALANPIVSHELSSHINESARWSELSNGIIQLLKKIYSKLITDLVSGNYISKQACYWSIFMR